jgi:hypothetical protein
MTWDPNNVDLDAASDQADWYLDGHPGAGHVEKAFRDPLPEHADLVIRQWCGGQLHPEEVSDVGQRGRPRWELPCRDREAEDVNGVRIGCTIEAPGYPSSAVRCACTHPRGIRWHVRTHAKVARAASKASSPPITPGAPLICMVSSSARPMSRIGVPFRWVRDVHSTVDLLDRAEPHM